MFVQLISCNKFKVSNLFVNELQGAVSMIIVIFGQEFISNSNF